MRKGRFDTSTWWGDTMRVLVIALASALLAIAVAGLVLQYRASLPLAQVVARPSLLLIVFACIVFAAQYKLTQVNARHGHDES